MTKKHFEWAAKYIGTEYAGSYNARAAARAFAVDFFATFGTNFDHKKFNDAIREHVNAAGGRVAHK